MTKVAVVTGGSRGIGAAAAVVMAARGWDVCVGYRGRRRGGRAGWREVPAMGRRSIAVGADVRREADVVRLFETTDESLGRLDALVNGAGVVDQRDRVAEMSFERLERMFAVNVLGSFMCARQAVLRMSTREGGVGGVILNLSSAAARLGSPGEYVDYAASKGAIDTMTVGLAREVADEAIRVNAVRPGLVDTDIHASGGQPDRVRRLAPMIPMQRGGSVSELPSPSCGCAPTRRRMSPGPSSMSAVAAEPGCVGLFSRQVAVI